MSPGICMGFLAFHEGLESGCHPRGDTVRCLFWGNVPRLVRPVHCCQDLLWAFRQGVGSFVPVPPRFIPSQMISLLLPFCP